MKLAVIEQITELIPIEGADRIELAKIQGWKSVVKKGTYNIGDTIVFVPIDTIIHYKEWNSFLWSEDKDTDKPVRIKTKKLRNTVSQGVIFPTSIIPVEQQWNLGDDVASFIGVEKYEVHLPPQLAGRVKGNFPSHVLSKTDEDNLLSNIKVLEEIKNCKIVVVSLKMDGSSGTLIKDNEGNITVCSRSINLEEGDNAFWNVVKKYDLHNKIPNNTAIQFEVCGPGIQSNKAGLKELNYYLFNYKDLNSDRYIDTAEISEYNKAERIAVFYEDDVKNLNIDYLQELANKQKYQNGNPAEGIVIRGIEFDENIQKNVVAKSNYLHKMMSVKVINQNY
jgi:RNA ligase (TIGR02306 family)